MMTPWIDPDWLDFKSEIAEHRDVGRRNRWRAAPWYLKILIWLTGDSPNGANHKADWR